MYLLSTIVVDHYGYEKYDNCPFVPIRIKTNANNQKKRVKKTAVPEKTPSQKES